MHKFLENSHYYLQMYKKNSAGMMLTNAIKTYMQQQNYIKIGQAKTKKLRFIFMFCSDTSVTKMKMFFMKHTSYSFNITSENTIFIPT